MKKILKRFKGGFRAIKTMACELAPTFWSRVYVLFDFVFCKLVLRCTIEEYCLYEFYKYKTAYRKQFILKSHKKTRLYAMNPSHFALHKKVTYRKIARGIKREMLYMPEIPNGAAINEAVEIAKKYETPETVKFMNGILGSFVRQEVGE